MAERAKRLRWLGIDKGTWDRSELDKSYWWEYFVDEIGLKCHMNDIMAAIGLVQLSKLDAMNSRRRDIANIYSTALGKIGSIEIPLADNEDYQSSWHIYCIKVDQRDELSAFLQENGIASGVHYKPIHLYKCYGNSPYLPVAEAVFRKILSLPMHPCLSNDEVTQIVSLIKDFSGRTS
jgi:perosamine synthetase